MLKILKLMTLISVCALSLLSPCAAQANDKVDYVLGAGDSIKVNVFRSPDLTTEVRVSESGTITYPLIGEVKVGGKTIQAAEQIISQALTSGGFVKKPQVNIVLLQIRGNQVAVLGMVNKPGRYPLDTSKIHLSEMIATAGGVAPIAGNGSVLLTGTRENKPYKYEVDIASLFFGDKNSQDIVLNNGDVIYISPGNQISILGQVLKPGRFAVEGPKMRLVDALAMSGGMVPTASDSVVISGIREGKPFKQEVDVSGLFLSPDLNNETWVMAGDQIYVHRAPVFYIYGEVQHPSSYRVERNMTVVQALAQGGGPTARGTQRNIKLHRRNANGDVEKTTPKLTDLIKPNDVLYVEESLF
jgi:polysaccharide export outer membrane protein